MAAAAVIALLAWLIPPGDAYDQWVRSEFGVIENATILCCAIGIVLSLSASRRVCALPYAVAFRWLMYLFAIGFFVLGGEEASWGQHVFGWGGKEMFTRETNLHNLSISTEQIPKALLHVAAVLGGLVWPWFLAPRWRSAPDWLHWLMPTKVVSLSVVFALLVRLFERLLVWFDYEPIYTVWENFKELKEANELFLVFFLLLYVLSLRKRAGHAAARGTGQPAP